MSEHQGTLCCPPESRQSSARLSKSTRNPSPRGRLQETRAAAVLASPSRDLTACLKQRERLWARPIWPAITVARPGLESGLFEAWISRSDTAAASVMDLTRSSGDSENGLALWAGGLDDALDLSHGCDESMGSNLTVGSSMNPVSKVKEDKTST